jgi:NAD dependent epimerase/dehydratase family enzyme
MSSRGWEVIVLSRRPQAATDGVRVLEWDGRSIGLWADVVDGSDVVLNLAGRSVNCRYNRRNRDEIMRSRVESTRVLGEAITRAHVRPRVWLNSSTATIYRHAEDRPQDELSGEIGSGFSIDVARAWEKEFFDAPASGVRKIAMRSAMVMGPGSGGAFATSRRFMPWRATESAGEWRRAPNM